MQLPSKLPVCNISVKSSSSNNKYISHEGDYCTVICNRCADFLCQNVKWANLLTFVMQHTKRGTLQ